MLNPKPSARTHFQFQRLIGLTEINSISWKRKSYLPLVSWGKLIRFLWPVMLVVGCKILEIGPESWFVNNPIPDPSRQSDLRYELITAALDLVLKTANMENCINILINGMVFFIYVFVPSLSLRSICLDLMKIFLNLLYFSVSHCQS